MKEILITSLYWVLNLTILIAALLYAQKIWEGKHRLVYAVSLLVGGSIWHIFKGIYIYNTEQCKEFVGGETFLTKANKCIPEMSYDIIWAQIAIFVGLFVLVAIFFNRGNKNQS